MATSENIPQTVSPADALWSLFMSQTKAVKKEFLKRIKELEVAKRKNEIDLSLEEIKQGKTISFENVEDAINYLNS